MELAALVCDGLHGALSGPDASKWRQAIGDGLPDEVALLQPILLVHWRPTTDDHNMEQ